MKRLAKTALKLAVTALLLFLLYRKVDGRAFADALRGIRWAWVPPFFAIALANMWISSWRWSLLLRSDGADIPVRKLFASHWIASFFNFFLPSNIGGDVYRVADIGRRSGSAVGSLASVFVDRLCGFLALSLMGFLFPLLGLRLVPAENRGLLLVPLAVFLGFLCVAALLWQQGIVRFLARALPGRLRAKVERLLDTFFSSVSAYLRRPRTLAAAFGLSLAFQFLVLVAVWTVCRALSIPVSLAECCVFVPFVCLLEAVPLTVNGIGLRDTGYAMFFAAVGLAGRGADPAASAAALSLCYMAFTLAYACGGGLLFLRRMFAAPRPS
jgi:hypothetical protein